MNAAVADSRQLLDEGAPPVRVEQHPVAVGPRVRLATARSVEALVDHRAATAGAQPQQRSDAVERDVQLDSLSVEVGQLEELDVLLEALGHRELVGELVVALDRRHRPACGP